MVTSSKAKRCCIYLRVSTNEQDTTMQRRDLVEYADARGWSVVQISEDKASGTNSNRNGLRELQRAACQRKFDVLLVWKLDRIFRSTKDCLHNLHDFAEFGVEFVSLKDSGIDMTTPSGKLLLHVLAAFAEFEASIIKMRVMAGLDLARKRGKILGRPKKRNDEKIRRLRQEGNSLRDIARLTGVSTTAVQRCLKAVTKSR